MSAGAFPSDVHQRAVGELRLVVRRRGTATVVQDLRQMGCLKARFPYPEEGAWASAITLNSSGGVAAGDVLQSEIVLGADTRFSVASQAAERFYRALPGAAPARLRTRITVGERAAAEWLPQETLLFDDCALDRALDIAIAPDAWFLGVESLIFGRAAMGEQVHRAQLSDVIRLRRNGALIRHDAIRLRGEIAAPLARAATAGGRRAVATILHAAPDAALRLDALRAALAPYEAGASAWDGVLQARILAADSTELRAAVIAGLATIRNGRTLPRVWLC